MLSLGVLHHKTRRGPAPRGAGAGAAPPGLTVHSVTGGHPPPLPSRPGAFQLHLSSCFLGALGCLWGCFSFGTDPAKHLSPLSHPPPRGPGARPPPAPGEGGEASRLGPPGSGPTPYPRRRRGPGEKPPLPAPTHRCSARFCPARLGSAGPGFSPSRTPPPRLRSRRPPRYGPPRHRGTPGAVVPAAPSTGARPGRGRPWARVAGGGGGAGAEVTVQGTGSEGSRFRNGVRPCRGGPLPLCCCLGLAAGGPSGHGSPLQLAPGWGSGGVGTPRCTLGGLRASWVLPPCSGRVCSLPCHSSRWKTSAAGVVQATWAGTAQRAKVRGRERRIPALERGEGGKPSGSAFVCTTIKANSVVLPGPLSARSHLCRALCALAAASSSARQRQRVQRRHPNAEDALCCKPPARSCVGVPGRAEPPDPVRGVQRRGAPRLPASHTRLCRCHSRPSGLVQPLPALPGREAHLGGFGFGPGGFAALLCTEEIKDSPGAPQRRGAQRLCPRRAPRLSRAS